MAVMRYLVDDVDAALPFYESLGFVLDERWGAAFAIVTRGDVRLWLSGPGTSARRPLADGSMPVSGGWNRLVLEVDDLDAALAVLPGAKASPIEGPGGRQALVRDPSGNPVELFQARSST
jgi:catechol 2,3-dioxygenase-like lactoylglutathione lyase family enzyme